MYSHVCEECGKSYTNRKQYSRYCSLDCKYKGISKKRIVDITGKRYGRLEVLYMKTKKDNERTKWICKCDCGKIVEVIYHNLSQGITKSCGCLHSEIVSSAMKNKTIYKDLVGFKFNDLTVLKKIKDGIWECKCVCGNVVQVSSGRLVNNITKSCGCKKRLSSKSNAQTMLKVNHDKNFKEGTSLAMLQPKKISINNKSGRTGVCWNKTKQKWDAYITIKRKRIYLGSYKNKEKAISVRETAEEKYFKPILDKYKKSK